MDATQTFLSTADGIPNSGASAGAGYAALDSIAGDIGAPLQFSAAIDVAQRQFGNRATLQFVHRQQAHRVAQAGLRDAGEPYPFLGEIQRSFGQHDISGLEGHTGEAAREANSELGSTAYHKGGHVAFGQAPTLANAAHEAAHYVQGVGATQLKGGVGQAGDVYERHADRVAAAVVAGEAAEPILDQTPGGSGSPATATGDAPLQMTGGSLSQASGQTGRKEEERSKQTKPIPLEGASGGDVSPATPRFFSSTADFFSYTTMIQRHVEAMRSSDPDFYSPFRHVDDYKYGVIEAIIAQTDREVIENNLRRIREQYTGVTAEPGTLDLFRMTAKNSRGQYEGIPHLTGRVNMGDRSFHSHLRIDLRQLIETNEEGKEVMGEDGKPLRKWIRPLEQPEDYGVLAGTVLPSKNVPYTYLEEFNDGPTHYKGQKIRGYPPTSTTFIPMARYSRTPLPQAFSALMLAELAKNASMGVYNQIDTTCVPWPLDLARAGGADMKQISLEYASGERDLRNTQLAAEIDHYLAYHTDYHPDRKVLGELRDQAATVVGRDGVTRPLNYHEGAIGNPDFEVFARYSDGTRPWREPQDAPWPWEKDYCKPPMSVQTYGPKFGPYRDVEEFRREVATVQHRVTKQKAKDPDYALRLTFDQLKFGVMEAVIAHADPAVIEANLKRIEEKYSGVEPMPGTATYYHYVAYAGRGLGETGQHVHMSHPSVEVKMGDMGAHSDLRGDSRRYPKDEGTRKKWGTMTKEEQRADNNRRRLRPKIKPADYSLDLGVSPTDMTIMEHPDTSFPDYENYPVTEDIVKEIARFENIELPEAFTALLLMEFWHLASIGPYDVHRTTCAPIPLDVMAAGGVDMARAVPSYAKGSRNIMDPQLILDTDRFLAFHSEPHINQKLLDQMRDPNAKVTGADGQERLLNHLGTKDSPYFLREYGGMRPWEWSKDAPWPWDREYWEAESKKPK